MKRICCNKNCGLVWDEGDTLDYKHAVGAHLCPECYEVTEIIGNPKRIQRKRTKGWRMPENTIYVGRPTIYGNPFKVGMVLKEADIIYGSFNYQITIPLVGKPLTAKDCVNLYKYRVTDTHFGASLINKWRSELAGHDLACWCKEGEPCHADVLIELLTGVDK